MADWEGNWQLNASRSPVLDSLITRRQFLVSPSPSPSSRCSLTPISRCPPFSTSSSKSVSLSGPFVSSTHLFITSFRRLACFFTGEQVLRSLQQLGRCRLVDYDMEGAPTRRIRLRTVLTRRQVCTKVASFLEQGQRLENLSWRLWHLQNLMVDTDNAKSKREFRKLSKCMSDKLDKEKGRCVSLLRLVAIVRSCR